jgi:hypothetical protein
MLGGQGAGQARRLATRLPESRPRGFRYRTFSGHAKDDEHVA